MSGGKFPPPTMPVPTAPANEAMMPTRPMPDTMRPPLAPPDRPFHGLSRDEATFLNDWCRGASSIGIDVAEDLSARAWPCAIEGAVIGVFRAGHDSASWLVIRQGGEWVVACQATLSVSTPVGSLAEALRQLETTARALPDL
jgi:hypothetical protein